MYSVLACLAIHDWRLVVLAGVICFFASLAAVRFLLRVRASRGVSRFSSIVTAGAAIGCGIWATHCIAMLAYQPGFQISFHAGFTALSLITAIPLVSLGIAVAAFYRGTFGVLVGGVVFSIGAVVSHYFGMLALEIPAQVSWRLDLIAASIPIGVAFAIAGIALAMSRSDLPAALAAALLLTVSIVAQHFIAMSAVVLVPDPTRAADAFAMSDMALAITVAGITAALLATSFVSVIADRRLALRTNELGRKVGTLEHARQEVIKSAEATLREHNVRLDAALNNMSQGLCMFDRDRRLVVCNARYLEMYDLRSEDVQPGITLHELLQLRLANGTYSGDTPKYMTELREILTTGRASNKLVELKGGRTIAIINQPMSNGGWVATHEDITEQRRTEERLAYLALHDTLTDLPNRAAFAEHLDATMAAAATSGESFAVICIDLDRFKEINDVFGHSLGDSLLREAGRRLVAAADGALVARMGGDEFTIVVAQGTQPASAAEIADSLQAAFGDDFEIDGNYMRSGLSIGVAIYPNDGRDAATLLGNADAALYRAKAAGRGVIRFFEADMDMRLRERRALQHELRNAIANGEFVTHYQPQTRMDRSVIGFEVLIRWQHPTRGLVPPGQFIPLAEESGLINTLGEWVLRTACREAASWPRPLQIAVNLSPVQFRHGDLPGLVHSVLLETGLSPRRLELEITEGVLIEDFSRGLSILRRLKALGVRIAMDDFGTGYSSLSYLQSFPFDKIKIDHTFISNLERNPQSAAIVRAVIGLAQGLDLPVLAEGVETRDQFEFLARESCDEVQGFLLGRPRPISDYADVVGHTPKVAWRAAG